LKNDKPIDIFNYIKNNIFCPNAYIIMLIILVSVISAVRGFSNLKIIKIYLKSTISHKRLNQLVLLSITKNIKWN